MMGTSATSLMPWNTNDVRELEAAINNLSNIADYVNRRWSQKWFETFQFVIGNQNLKWSKTYDFAVDSDNLTQDFSSARRSQTNLTRTIVESLSSMLYNQLPELYFESRYDNSSHAYRLAKVLEGLKKCYDERLQLHDEFDFGSVIYSIYSMLYSKVSYKKGAGSKLKTPKQRVVQKPRMTTAIETDPQTGEQIMVPVPTFDEAGNIVMMDVYENVTDEVGNTVYDERMTGDVCVDMLTPFEVSADHTAKTFSKIKWIQQARVMDYDEFMEEFYDQPGAIHEILDRVQGGVISGPSQNIAMRHMLRTLYSSPPTMDSAGRSFASPFNFFKNKVFVIEHYDRPSEGHPLRPTPWLKEGRRSVMVNGYLGLMSTPQYRMNTTSGWHPFNQCRWMPLAQVGQSSGPLTDSAQKNRELNMTDSMMSHAIQRDSASVLLVNETSSLDKNKITGEPGQTHYVTGDPSTAAAYLRNGQPLPPLVNLFRETQKQDMFELSGALEATRGERSTGATSGFQARLYEERERKRVSKATNNWEGFLAATYMKMFSCFQQNVTIMDPNVISRVQRATQNQATASDVLNFLNGPLDFGIDATVRAGSTRTKSQAAKQQDIQEAMNNPAVAQRVMQDPAMLDAYLEQMGIEAFRDVSSVHRERARKENMWFYDALNWGPEQIMANIGTAPTAIGQDDDLQHYQQHMRDFVENFDRYQKNPTLLKMFDFHMEQHKANAKVKAGEQHPLIMRVFSQMFDMATATAEATNLKDAPLREIVGAFNTQKLAEQEAAQLAAQVQGKDQTTPAENAPAGE